MFDHSNTPGTARTEDQPLVKAIKDARSQYGFSAATAGELFDDFTKPKPALRQWIFDLCDPSPRASPFMTDDEVAAFARDLSGQDCSARRVERLAHRIKRFVQDKRRVWMGAGRPQNVDRALILYVIRRIEEATGIPFGFSRPQPRYHLGGPRLLLAEAALHRLFAGLDRLFPDDWVSRYLGLASPARHYTRDEIARTAKLVRRFAESEQDVSRLVAI